MAKVKLENDAKQTYEKIVAIAREQSKRKKKTKEIQLVHCIDQKVLLLQQNPFAGIQILKQLIPKYYNVQNLWKIDLVGYWRMLYTIKGDKVEILCFVVDILDHPGYDKRFGYKS